jgi:hypothetical protein
MIFSQEPYSKQIVDNLEMIQVQLVIVVAFLTVIAITLMFRSFK